MSITQEEAPHEGWCHFIANNLNRCNCMFPSGKPYVVGVHGPAIPPRCRFCGHACWMHSICEERSAARRVREG